MEKKVKKYGSAPLPFQGQKRRHVHEFSNLIKEIRPNLVVDLFGGSGLLSYVAKQANPKSRVLYNDYVLRRCKKYFSKFVHFVLKKIVSLQRLKTKGRLPN